MEFTRKRSKFWLKIFDNPDSVNLSANKMTKELISRVFPYLVDNSPTKWKKSDKYYDVYNLWLPNDRYDWEDLDELELWAGEVNKFIWLSTNNKTKAYFSGEELDFCVASDWNFDFEEQTRTLVGNAEYLLKYKSGILTDEQRRKQVGIMAQAVQGCVSSLPIDINEFIVTTIPASEKNQRKLSWSLARYIARSRTIPFAGFTLTKEKPEMKSLPLSEKISTWRSIYSDQGGLVVPEGLYGKNFLIVDDLYQSGTSIFCLAEYLRTNFAAEQVVAVASVKSQKDGDNT